MLSIIPDVLMMGAGQDRDVNNGVGMLDGSMLSIRRSAQNTRNRKLAGQDNRRVMLRIFGACHAKRGMT